ncbi:hypothetical protein MMC09_003183 [Bachmanniomyces sp. S44760]|nr:hypothetical protein [Bachmanniomyces sp. S44760]
MSPSVADDSSVDDNVSSIGDSTWDILDDTSIISDDDRSFSRHSTPSSETPEHEAQHLEDMDSVRSSEDDQEPVTAEHSLHQFNPRPVDDFECQELCSTPKMLHTRLGDEKIITGDTEHSEEQPHIKFDEPQNSVPTIPDPVEVTHTLHLWIMSTRNQAIRTIRQTMGSRGLSLDGKRPYKVLYAGNPVVRLQIMNKIGEALASLSSRSANSRTEPSRFSIVPISAFGAKSCPEVMLVGSSDLELIVEECSTIQSGNDRSLCMAVNQTEIVSSQWVPSLWNREMYTLTPNWKVPDLAVIYVSKEGSVDRLQLVRSFMKRHDIPTLIISETRNWGQPRLPVLDLRTPHLCLEIRDLPGPSIIDRLPIDLPTFLDLDAGQMSRNLACLSSARNASTSRSYGFEQTRGTAIERLLEHVGFPRGQLWQRLCFTMPPNFKSVLAVGITGLIVFLYLLTVFTPRIGPEATESQANVRELRTTNPTLTLVSTYPSITPKREPIKFNAQAPQTKSISLVRSSTDLASLLLDPAQITPNRSEHFMVHIIGDSHVILRTPHWLTRSKKSPKLFFRITRYDQVLMHNESLLFDGVHALRLSRELAHGPLNITVWTTSKPKIRETHLVDFGTPWLKVAGWRQAAQMMADQIREEVESAQKGLAVIYGRTSAGLQTFGRDARQRAIHVSKDLGELSLRSSNATATSRAVIVAQTQEISQFVLRYFDRRYSIYSPSDIIRTWKLRHDFQHRAKQASTVVSQQAQIWSKALTGIDTRVLARGIIELRRRYLRETQKQMLRAWWSVRGVPERKEPRGKCHGKCRSKRFV